jgi:hypothetical protein
LNQALAAIHERLCHFRNGNAVIATKNSLAFLVGSCALEGPDELLEWGFAKRLPRQPERAQKRDSDHQRREAVASGMAVYVV